MKAVLQAVTPDSLYGILKSWCEQGAGRRKDKIRILSAFASKSAVLAMEPLFDAFLKDGNAIEMIVGTDLGGTDAHAVRRLASLVDAYNLQFKVWMWAAPQIGSIFHPKMYTYCRDDVSLSSVIGSANFTRQGMAYNLESLFHFQDIKPNSTEARALFSVWDTFSKPKLPLKPEFLKELLPDYAAALIARLPRKSREDKGAHNEKRQKLWKSLSTIPFPERPPETIPQSVPANGQYLVMDILTETRQTQVQLPQEVVEGFFGASMSDQNTVFEFHLFRGSELSQPVQRHLVRHRYMRRIEIPQLYGLDRPCSIVFLKHGASNRFDYRIIKRNTLAYTEANHLLDTHGKRARERRFYIGTTNDVCWATAKRLLFVAGKQAQ